jgi:hypothetical protein
MADSCLKFLQVGPGTGTRSIAMRLRPGGLPGLVWLGGFRSDMQGIKAQALDAWGATAGRAVVRFDYSGHGESGGAFADGTIGRWLEESLAVISASCRCLWRATSRGGDNRHRRTRRGSRGWC